MKRSETLCNYDCFTRNSYLIDLAKVYMRYRGQKPRDEWRLRDRRAAILGDVGKSGYYLQLVSYFTTKSMA